MYFNKRYQILDVKIGDFDMGLHQRVFIFVLVVLMVQSTMVPSVAAQNEPPAGMDRALFEVGRFTYQASFQLDDGTEAFLIRGSYEITFLFQHHDIGDRP